MIVHEELFCIFTCKQGNWHSDCYCSHHDYEERAIEVAEAWVTDTESIDVREIKRLAWNEGAQAAYNSFENTGIGYKFRHVKNPYND